MKIQSHKDLVVWQKAMLLVKEIYKIAYALPLEEKFNLTTQLIRSVVSIPSNIAEGYCRKNKKEYIYFLSVAYSSAAELDTQLLIVGQQYTAVVVAPTISLNEEVQKMLYVLMRNLN